MPPEQKLLLEFLGVLEEREASLLTWGLVEGSFRLEELYEEAQRFLDEFDEEDLFDGPGALIRELKDQVLLFRDPLKETFRTRMAETIRLLSSLRQIFPNQDWRVAPSLVADYRLQIRPREYPERCHAPDEVEKRIAPYLGGEDLPLQLLRGILQAGSSTPFHLAEFQVCWPCHMRTQRSTLPSASAPEEFRDKIREKREERLER